MQALILATDETSRLDPLTEHIPVPLLPVLNRPVMAYPLELLARSGLRDIGVAVYNKAGRIEAHFGPGTSSGVQLTYLLQREPLGSAGSLRWAASGLSETFVVLPGDALVDFDICAALAFHQSHRGIATVIVHAPLTHGAPESDYPLHVVAVAPGGRVTAFSDSVAGDLTGLMAPGDGTQVFANTGAYIFDPRIFDWIPPLQRGRQVLDCHSDLLPQLLASEAMHAYVAEGYWNPIHSVHAYHQAQLDALASAGGRAVGANAVSAVRYVSVQDREPVPGIIAGPHVNVHPSARLVAPVHIGAGSQIERDVELGPGVVLGPNTIVDEGATIRNSSVLEGTYVGQLVNVDGRVVRGRLVVDARSGASLRIVDPFLLGDFSTRPIVGPVARLFFRAADSLGALLLLLLSLPALALIAFALLTSPFTGSPGRVLELRPRVRWRRTGEDDGSMDRGLPETQTYGVYYFRTRRPDGRLLPLGSFLEWTQFHGLPALLSVLKGNLRLVGVKPLDPSAADRLSEEWQRLPYEGPAGFTGLWYVQTSGSDVDEIVAADAYYTATRSFLEDLHLLLSTPVAWIRHFARHHTSSPKRHGRRRRSTVQRNLLSGSLAPAAKDAKD